ncbi:hypothetical protein [Mucilaginibacter defluvii]|uniref:Uncharacterized protein n=1 Tax=Mucilaginibacter defluvii TaxID=1196019 RepID=A0ABP9G4Y5_9SPHI
MNIKPKFIAIPSIVIAFLNLSAITSYTEKDYFGIKEISFNNRSYKLSWSSHPSLQYYKQEYLPEDETADKFKDMILIDFLQTDKSLEDAVNAQVNTLKIRKQSDAVCNYQLSKKGNEYILDFLMSEGSGYNLKLLEWNAYHYKEYTDKFGNKGILMFGFSHRAYDSGAEELIQSLAQYRNKLLNIFVSHPIPEIQIK